MGVSVLGVQIETFGGPLADVYHHGRCREVAEEREVHHERRSGGHYPWAESSQSFWVRCYRILWDQKEEHPVHEHQEHESRGRGSGGHSWGLACWCLLDVWVQKKARTALVERA